jgi:hypothetical protein
MKLAFIISLLLASSPVAAQTSQVQQPLGTGGVTNNSPLTNTGVICQEEMVATFCNVASSPNHAGYGSNGGAAATSAGITTPLPLFRPVEKASSPPTSYATEAPPAGSAMGIPGLNNPVGTLAK